MGIDLSSVSGGHRRASHHTWRLALALAHRHGWKPAWTTLRGSSDWDGSYCKNSGQRISPEDARALGNALKRALRGLSRRDLTDEAARRQIVAKVCHIDRFQQYLEQQFGEGGEVTLPGSHAGDGPHEVLMIPADEMIRIYREFPDYVHDLSHLDLLHYFSGPARESVSELARFFLKSNGVSIF
jgi:hypothetical protein